MEISFEGREAVVYREFAYQTRRTQETAECVVPDTDADIEKIVTVQSAVLLKSKDLSARGVLVSGELSASVLYIGEGQGRLSALRLRKPFTMEFEAEGLASETMAQIALRLQGADLRLINPRKISLLFDVEGELSCYGSEKLPTEVRIPEDTPGLHARTESRSVSFLNAVCEKSFAVNEQFVFPAEPVPERLCAERARLTVTDCQLLGSKMIVKGSLILSVCALAEEGDRPLFADFEAPFSQIVDVGAERMEASRVRPEITGSYFDLVDTINGQKALDVEVHAVLQLVCCESREISCVTDAYSNLMPAQLKSRTRELLPDYSVRTKRLCARERVGLMENCAELVRTFPSVSRLTAEGGKLSAAVALDFLYRNEEGKLSACRRTLNLSADTEEDQLQILSLGQLEAETVPDGESVDCTLTLELDCLDRRKESFTTVEGVILDEDRAYAQGSLPSLTLIRREGESLWTLAKKYHSSEEKIRELNADADSTTRMLLIPKCV
jgi:hypothetical protein